MRRTGNKKQIRADKMAEIVYEGDVGGGGNLFAGMKFFFLQRLPARQKYMQDVTVIYTASDFRIILILAI